MGKWTGTIIGGGIGWALFGPLGALLGAYIGSMFSEQAKQSGYYQKSIYGDTQAGDFAVALLSLFAYVSKSDHTVRSSEVQYVKKYLAGKFGQRNTQDLMYLYKEILKKDYNIHDVSRQISQHMDYYSRLELVHVLYGIAGADNVFQKSEMQAIQEICAGLGVTKSDHDSIRAMFVGVTSQAYVILNVNPEDSNDTIKKAYRELAVKYHPDKVANLGPEIQKLAEEKFKAINDAYQAIRKKRGL